ncbi:hypothetical protein Acr_06g0007240 [Actinidia rufa]|uniref:Uncharacterized protein n=1 Tax=Actinidia rufa TaxID=165716 RepID=A0A7J0EQM1_9ERIC|nr:hypothetical protein Acr_06g0007240 [Actinidia rufa]
MPTMMFHPKVLLIRQITRSCKNDLLSRMRRGNSCVDGGVEEIRGVISLLMEEPLVEPSVDPRGIWEVEAAMKAFVSQRLYFSVATKR